MSDSRFKGMGEDRVPDSPAPFNIKDSGEETPEPQVEEIEMVNHPLHYNQHPSGVECIEIVKHYDFCIGNCIKYLWRAGLKGGNPALQDLKKAAWYLNEKIKMIEKEQVENNARNA